MLLVQVSILLRSWLQFHFRWMDSPSSRSEISSLGFCGGGGGGDDDGGGDDGVGAGACWFFGLDVVAFLRVLFGEDLWFSLLIGVGLICWVRVSVKVV